MKSRKSLALSIAAALSAALLSSTASATPPASVTGVWTILVDNAYTTLDIASQGGPANGTCRVINGTIDIAPIRGIYCPDTGSIDFVHSNIATGAAVRTFRGSVSEDAAAGVMHMAGTLSVLNSAFGAFGEYPFSANK